MQFALRVATIRWAQFWMDFVRTRGCIQAIPSPNTELPI